MNTSYANEMYDQHLQRSPGASLRHQQPRDLPRQNSRQFNGYADHQPNPYQLSGLDENARYDAQRYDSRQGAATLHSGYSQQHDFSSASIWNNGGAANYGGNNTMSGITSRMKGQNRGRSNLPQAWVGQDHQQHAPAANAGAYYGSNGPSPLGISRDVYIPPDNDDELIPTAIVIKNIPFAVKKESLMQLMAEMGLPLPYAFNYHFDNGIFRGLAFANFTGPQDTAAVIEALNHFELNGRKLRVEYKKMLPAAERERIEREKRERRGQLQEQHMTPSVQTLNNQPSLNSINSHRIAASPSPVAGRDMNKPVADLNDPQVRAFYTELIMFKNDPSRDTISFPPSLTNPERRAVHTLAHELQLGHDSQGTGDQRAVHVWKLDVGPNMSPPIPQLSQNNDPNRRALNRAATTDFSDVRDSFYNTLGRQGSGYLGFPESPRGGLMAAQYLRGAKSYADLRSYTPSPVPSTASIPNNLPQPTMRSLLEQHPQGSMSATNISNTQTAPMTTREESLLSNGFSGMNLGNGYSSQTSPKRGLRGMMSWDRENGNAANAPGPIGGHRSMSTTYNDNGRPSHPHRQPQGPMANQSGFGRQRQNGHRLRGSDELSSQSQIELLLE